MPERADSGTSSTYIEGISKVTGTCQYTFDTNLPGMLVGKLLHPPYARARITRLDTTDAAAMPGVYAVVTQRDLPGEKRFGYIVKDQPIFAIDEICYIGDVVAAVAAINEDVAEAALQAIEVDYEPLEGVFDPLVAMQSSAILARSDLKDNILSHSSIRHGDVAQGFAQADVIVEHTYRTQTMDQLFMETEGAIAEWEDGNLTVLAGGQYPHRDQIQLAEFLCMPASRVRVIYPFVGGAFGGKDELHVQIPVALLAQKAHRPVKLVRSRYESLLTHVKRHGMTVRYKTGARADGTLTAIEAEIVGDAGPYTAASAAVLGFAAEMATGCYSVPSARIDSYSVATNNLNCGAMRGFGGPQVAFAGEQNMDRVAEALHMDPVELRLKNGMEKGTLMPSGAYIYYDIAMKETLRQAAEASSWETRDQWLERAPAPHLRRGLGVASIYHGFGIGTRIMDQSNASLEMLPDGSVTLKAAFGELGQGTHTAMVMLTAQELGIPPESVRWVRPDTLTSPDAGSTTASRTVYMVGNAIVGAAAVIRQSLLEIAAEDLEARPEQLALADGKIYALAGPADRYITVAAAANKAWSANKQLTGMGHSVMWDPPEPKPKANYPVPHTVFAYGTQIAQVLVDIETGQVQVEKIWAANDLGKAINRLGAEGQIVGGAVQGLGYALMEELQVEEGQLLTSSLETYAIPTAEDVPLIEHRIVEIPDPTGPRGAKGLGEATLTPTAPAIANAIADATGVRLSQLPLTPERVLAALRAAGVK